MPPARPLGSLVCVALALLLVGCSSLGFGKRWGHPVHVSEAVALSHAGVEPEKIVAKMNRAGTVYNLTDRQYEEIRERGVTPRVIFYMRQTYIQAVAEHPKLKDQEDLSCWYLGPDGYWYGGGPFGFHPDC